MNLEKIRMEEHFDGELMWQVLELYNQVVRQAAHREKVLLIDLAGEMPKNSEYYYDYLHYTEAGAAEVAKIISRSLKPFLAARYPEFKR